MKKKITIEIDVSLISHKGRPAIFIKGINDILPYKTRRCNFISSKNIYLHKGKMNSN
jgi:hypothetical protein